MAYPSDLRDKDWDLIEHHFSVGTYGNRAVLSRRSLVNGILYVVKRGVSGGCCHLIFRRGRGFMANFDAFLSSEFGRKC